MDKLLRRHQREIAGLRKEAKRRKKLGYMDRLALRVKGFSYERFLQSNYWQKVRQRVLKRDGFKCRICKNGSELHVHHDTYKNHFQEHKHLGDLLTLCKDCHTDYHKNIVA